MGFYFLGKKEGAIKAAEEGLQQSDSTPWKTRFESLISDLKADKEVFN